MITGLNVIGQGANKVDIQSTNDINHSCSSSLWHTSKMLSQANSSVGELRDTEKVPTMRSRIQTLETTITH